MAAWALGDLWSARMPRKFALKKKTFPESVQSITNINHPERYFGCFVYQSVYQPFFEVMFVTGSELPRDLCRFLTLG